VVENYHVSICLYSLCR